METKNAARAKRKAHAKRRTMTMDCKRFAGQEDSYSDVSGMETGAGFARRQAVC